MHPIDQAAALLLKGLRCCDICQHHELLDELHGFQPLAEGDGLHLAVLAEHDAALRQVEIERIAHATLDRQRLIAGPQIGQRLARRRVQRVIRIAVEGALCPGIGKACRRPHDAADEFVMAPLLMPANPPTIGYSTTNAFPGITFTNPVCIASPPGETNRLFVLNRTGTILVITNLASPNLTTFMSIPNIYSAGESGLLGLAFDPEFAENGYFYVNYTSKNGVGDTVIARYQVSAGNPNVANPGSATPLSSSISSASTSSPTPSSAAASASEPARSRSAPSA